MSDAETLQATGSDDLGVTRRTLLRYVVAGSAAIASASLLAACGSDDDDDPTSPANAEPTSSGAEPQTTPEDEPQSTPETPESEPTDASASSTSELPEELIVGTSGEPPNANPILGTQSDSIFRSSLIFDSLAELDGVTLEPVPRLAKSWEISGDGLTYAFELVEGATWHDGEPVTADDVAFTVYMILHPDYTGPFGAAWTLIEGAEEVTEGGAESIESISLDGPTSVSFTLSSPYAPFLALGAARLKVIPQHLLADVGPGEMLESDFEQNPVGSGPYRFVSHARDADWVVEAYEDYWGGAPAVKRFVHRVIPDTQTLVIAMETGEIHGSIYAAPTMAERLREQPTLEVIIPPFSYSEALVFNNDDPVLSNKAIRKAVALGLDTQTFADEFLLGLGEPGRGPIAPANWAFNENIEPYPYDVDQARSIIEDDGWTLGSDDIYEKDGLRASFTFLTNQGNVMREDFGTFLQAQMQTLGIEVQPEFVEWGLLVSSFTSKDYQSAFDGWVGALVDPDELYEQFHSNGSTNNVNYSNPELDQLLEAGRESIDQAERKQIYDQVQEILVDDVPAFWSWYRPYVHVVDKRFMGPWVIPTLNQGGIFFNIQKWGQQ